MQLHTAGAMQQAMKKALFMFSVIRLAYQPSY
jgi:hypothetical protein